MQTKTRTKTQPTRQLESQGPLSQSPSGGDGSLTESEFNTGGRTSQNSARRAAGSARLPAAQALLHRLGPPLRHPLSCSEAGQPRGCPPLTPSDTESLLPLLPSGLARPATVRPARTLTGDACPWLLSAPSLGTPSASREGHAVPSLCSRGGAHKEAPVGNWGLLPPGHPSGEGDGPRRGWCRGDPRAQPRLTPGSAPGRLLCRPQQAREGQTAPRAAQPATPTAALRPHGLRLSPHPSERVHC